MRYLRLVALLAVLASAYSKTLTGRELMDRNDHDANDQFQKAVESGHQIEGDMKLTAEQIALFGSKKEHNRALATSNWPKTGDVVNIPFTVDPNNNWSEGETANFQKAIKDFKDKTCIRFIERTNEEDYLHIIKGGGCWSWVGKDGGKQELSLDTGCLYDVGTPIHEFMHAIGYMHEQSRKDRDDYITVNWSNIQEGRASQFNKCENCDLQGLEYDTGSVMQYHEYAFSNGNGPTMVSKSGSKLGQDDGFSALDLKGINMIYCGGTGTEAPTTAAPTTQAPTTPETTAEPPTEACIADASTWNAGWGTCDTYDDTTGHNHGFCQDDCNSNGECAYQVCQECGSCSSDGSGCIGDASEFDAGWGTCDTYEKDTGINNFFCEQDCNAAGQCASQVCAECGCGTGTASRILEA